MRDVSALTIARGRHDHLCNVILGLAGQTRPPRELVIGVMQPDPYADLPETPFPVRQIIVQRDDGELPLAAARNAVANAAKAEVLAFVDVDCIPHPDLIRDVATACGPGQGLVMGEVAYLPAGATETGLDFTRFDQIGVRHSDRQAPPPEGLRPCPDYRCFWSLNFAMHRDDWARTGGFDEGYYGYGGEDTDFGRDLDARGIDIWWMKGAKVYHQYHDHCMPPIHHVASVLRNADHFASRWGHRTMGHWLHGFHLMGLIDNAPEGLTILRDPDEADFALCRQTGDMPYANTRRVIDHLERAVGTEAGRRASAERSAAAFTAIAAE
ncbi:glycosyl transferase [Salipiger aestuarii]|uniref:GT2 family glycosyltransferase n=1 Tax=Salipiger aestuarii TaxID=568098 RepID=A0A327Y8T4_9RHOB|nr:galactosyltransferase-related protein [Salipiger aestuarii]KAB2541773.1 glycosyl transferase [Salipiger aestuarii]RAK17224.1 GT2 family glycosyltransferase [Salipiger aestuarii]